MPMVDVVAQDVRVKGTLARVSEALTKPVDAAGLAYFRVVFGAILAWEAWRYADHGWILEYFSGRDFYFTYWPFTFVSPWPEQGMVVHFAVIFLAALSVMLGFYYRVSAVVLLLSFGYFFLLDKANYLNHLYLVCLLCVLMTVLPAHRCFSVDARIRRGVGSRTVPAWTLWLLRFQIAVPFFFAGIAKLNADWLRGRPLDEWLADRTDFPIIGPYFVHEPVVLFFAYSSLLLDLFVVFFLLSRRTRVWAFLAALLFHLMNARLFSIGIFPWLMIAASPVFFEPDWPRRAWQDVKEGRGRGVALVLGAVVGYVIGALLPGARSVVHAVLGALGFGIAAYHLDEPFRPRPESATPDDQPAEPATQRVRRPLGRVTAGFLALWVGSQLLVPLRHLAIPGNVNWTEEGHRWSWRMKLRDKWAQGYFVVTEPGGRRWDISPYDVLSQRQVEEMLSRPDMIVQFAHFLEDRFRAEGHHRVEIYARILASLNGRPQQRLIDPKFDLTQASYPWLGQAEWIVPLRPD